jgi:hypothetical protein
MQEESQVLGNWGSFYAASMLETIRLTAQRLYLEWTCSVFNVPRFRNCGISYRRAWKGKLIPNGNCTLRQIAELPFRIPMRHLISHLETWYSLSTKEAGTCTERGSFRTRNFKHLVETHRLVFRNGMFLIRLTS